jgi:hypothetical protein
MKPKLEKKKKKNQSEMKKYLLSNIMLEVTTNLTPARFSTARLLQKPTRLTINPIRKHKSHFMHMYCNICNFPWLLQSCLNNSFSNILHPHFAKPQNQHFSSNYDSAIRRIRKAVGTWNLLVVEALDGTDFGPDDGDLGGGVGDGSLRREQRNSDRLIFLHIGVAGGAA